MAGPWGHRGGEGGGGRGLIILQKVGPDNVAECGIGCLINRRNPGFQEKVAWLDAHFREGLRYLLFRDEQGKPLAFLEYTPGEHAWRPVRAEGWLFVHCLWVYSRGQKVGGLGSRLIQACLDKAGEAGTRGVAAVVSDGPWMAPAGIFLSNGFRAVAESGRFQLVARRLVEGGPDPAFREVAVDPRWSEGLHLVYAPQCPMLRKSVTDLREMASEHGLELQVTELRTAAEAQRAPSPYGVYALLWDGRLLSDHYVSKGRFRGLLKKEILGDATGPR